MADTPTYNFLLQLCSFVSHGFLASHLQQTDVNKVRLHVASHVYKFPTQEIDANKVRLQVASHLQKIDVNKVWLHVAPHLEKLVLTKCGCMWLHTYSP